MDSRSGEPDDRRDAPWRPVGRLRTAVLGSILALAVAIATRPADRVGPQAAGLTPFASEAASEQAVVAGEPVVVRSTDEPAIDRAAEAGLQRLRLQIAQAMPVAGGDEGEGRQAAAQPAADLPDGARPVEPALRRAAATTDADRPRSPTEPAQRVLTLTSAHPGPHAPPAEGSLIVIGEATLLIRSHGLTVLTDPNFLRRGERARLAPALWAARRADPAIDLDGLPPIDVVVVTRLREDHFDRLARRRLPRDLPIVAPADARSRLLAMGFSSVHALPDWGTLRIERGDAWLQLTATPTRTAPALLAGLLPAAIGALLEFGRDDLPAAHRMWISGDTVIDDTLGAQLEPRLGALDLALLYVGGASVLGFGGSMDPAGSLRAVERLAPRTAIPLRLDDFSADPVQALRPAPSGAVGLRVADREPNTGPPRVKTMNRGETHRFAPPQYWALVRGDLPAAP